MKKIALILALVMVFAVALVSCNEASENSTPANESSVSATEDSSTPADTDDSSEPADDSSDDAVSEEPSVPAEITGENVAAGKTYTTSLLYRQGGADVDWTYDANAAIAYPDDNDAELTDGVVAEVVAGDSYTAAEWVGLHASSPDYVENGNFAYVTVDLGEKTDITGVKVYVGCGTIGGGIASPSSVVICVSDDGETWTEVTGVVPQNPADTNVECVEIPCTANGQYVQVRFTSGGWIFVSEVEIYA